MKLLTILFVNAEIKNNKLSTYFHVPSLMEEDIYAANGSLQE